MDGSVIISKSCKLQISRIKNSRDTPWGPPIEFALAMARKTKRDVSAQIWNRPYLGEFALPSVKKGTTGISEVDLDDLGPLEQNLFLTSLLYFEYCLRLQNICKCDLKPKLVNLASF